MGCPKPRLRAFGVVVLVALVVSLAGPGVSPAHAAASAPFVLRTLELLEQHYVDQLAPAPLLNAALAAAEEKAGVQPFGGRIPDGADRQAAAMLFTQRFSELLSQIRGRVSPTELAYAATAGMLGSLHDSHTAFVEPGLYQEIKRRETGQASFTGVGISLLHRDGEFYVDLVYPRSPADRAGVRLFDRVLAVDGRITKSLAQPDVSKLIRGPAGAPVTLTVGRPGADRPLDITIVRAPVQVPDVTGRMLDDAIGYVHLHEFVPSTGSRFRAQVLGLKDRGMRALVVDLRGNPGGLVTELRDVASTLLPAGSPVLQMRVRTGQTAVIQTPSAPIVPDSLPVVALVDGETGSAAELLAAALQELSRASVVGVQTAGAVEISVTMDLPDGAGLSVTVARVMSAKGTRLEGHGVAPDTVEVLTSSSMNVGHDNQLDRAISVLSKLIKDSAGARPAQHGHRTLLHAA